MYHHLGDRKTFRMMTGASLLSAIIFLIFHIYIQHRNRLRQLNSTGTEQEELLQEDKLEGIKLVGFKSKKKNSSKWSKERRGSLQIDTNKDGILELRRVTLVDAQTQTEPVQFAATLALPETDEEEEEEEEEEEGKASVEGKGE
ncbi:hypothetical protein Pmani_007930 [Petrolisthes manimaculis]|uniref:Uncharacterized protein n=1 Tax=Petrolisthes manimaculis TaxID=1843537 RepID=A0AAE1UF65_9EUCA|nr:hypothetical protein Pmani_007930 [Petrolisthes manimaculis]